MRTYLIDKVPYFLIAICLLQVALSWSRPSEAIAWILAATGWIAWKFDINK